MSKYSALFNSQSRSDDSSTTVPAAASTTSSTPLSSSNSAEQSTAASSAGTMSAASSSPSPRSRLVRRRRDGVVNSDPNNKVKNDVEYGGKNNGISETATKACSLEAAPGTADAKLELAVENAKGNAVVRYFQQPQEEGKNEVHDDGGSGATTFTQQVAGSVSADSTLEDADVDEESTLPRPSSSPTGEVSSSSVSPPPSSAPVNLYTCDACMHYVASSYHDLEQHALKQHGDALADYTRLRTVAQKLVPVWSQVLERKKNVIQQWGEVIFRVANQRDAGAAKMAEAHRARAQLELVVRRWHPNARVFIFGSSVAFGVWDGMSDIDFTVVDVDELEAGVWPPSEKNAVRTITELLRRAGFSYINLEPISHARVPIIKHHASLPIRLTDEQRRRLREEAQRAVVVDSGKAPLSSPFTTSPTSSGKEFMQTIKHEEENEQETQREEDAQLEAELVIARSVRYTLNLPATPLDSAVLEASIRLAVGSAAVQQVWWNRSREMCCVTFDTTTNAVKAATCPLHFVTPGMRARVQPLHEECRPELYGMDFDLSFRAFGIRNSHLLRRYLLSHPCARPGALVLKDWSKSSGVNNSVNGYLTSYAINIMWIYYLVHHNIIPYVSPTADIPASLRGNVSGDPEYAAMVDPTWTAEQRAAMQAQAGELLLGFFYYYAFDFDWENHVVSLNRPEVTTKAALGWDVEDVATPIGGGVMDTSSNGLFPPNSPPPPLPTQQNDFGSSVNTARRNRTTTRYSFCIEDPYEENLNLGRHMGVTKTLRVQTELYRGLLSLLKDDVQHCCVFAGLSGTEAESTKKTQQELQKSKSSGDNNVDASSSGGEPTELPLRVLYRLMAISTRELALARSVHTSSPSAKENFPGIPLAQLTAAFEARAPAEWRVATHAWNVQQLLHRLGLKVHGNHYVLPRREVGTRRLATQVPTGVVYAAAPEPTVTSSSSSTGAGSAAGSTTVAAPQTTEQVAQMNQQLLRPVRAHHLSNDLIMAVTRGYECLTPQWVAWSKPWAALSAWWTDRRQTLSEALVADASAASVAATTHGIESANTAPSDPSSCFPSSNTASAVSSAGASVSSSHSQRASALPEVAMGAIHQTRKELFCQTSMRCGRRCTAPILSGSAIFDSRRRLWCGAEWRASTRGSAVVTLSSSQFLGRIWRVLFL